MASGGPRGGGFRGGAPAGKRGGGGAAARAEAGRRRWAGRWAGAAAPLRRLRRARQRDTRGEATNEASATCAQRRRRSAPFERAELGVARVRRRSVGCADGGVEVAVARTARRAGGARRAVRD